jgi:predicted dehydrogenase
MQKVGLIGAGWIAPFHLAALEHLRERGRVVWVADPDASRGKRIAERAGAQFLIDYRQALNQVDSAFVLVPHHLHYSVTLDCLRAGLHVLLEKPMANTLDQIDEMISVAEQSGKTLMIAYPHRYREGFKVFKKILDENRYGKLISMDSFMDETVEGYIAPWMTTVATLGGGCLFSASGHMLDIMLWICGDAQAAHMVGTRGRVAMEGEDTATCIIKFRNGVIGTVRHTWASPKPRIWYTMNAMCEKAYVTLTTTPLGNATTEGPRCKWQTRITSYGAKEEILFENDQGLDLKPEVEHFFTCVETGGRPNTDGMAARKLTELVLGAYDGARKQGANVF